MRLEVHQLSRKLYDVEFSSAEILNGSEIFIGRAQECHVVLDDQQVSRHHAILSYRDGKLFVKNISEFGGLSVNGNEVQEKFLDNGDKLAITDFNMIVDGVPEAAGEPEGLGEDDTASLAGIGSLGEQTAIMDMPSIIGDIASSQESTVEDTLDALVAQEPPVEAPSEEATEILEAMENSEDEFAQEDDSFSGDDYSELNMHMNSEQNEEFGAQESSEENSFDEDQGGFSDDSGFGEDAEDDPFGDSGFSDDGFGGAGDEATQVFQSFASYSLELDGERAPFDKYQIEEKEVYIGRDPEKCQIVLNDPEVSSVHAVIKKTLVNCYIEDLGSSNGTVFNGERVNKAELGNNDNFQIGSTYFYVKIASELLESEKDILMPVEDGQEVEVEEIVEEEVDYDELDPEGDGDYSVESVQEKSLIKRILNDPKKKRIAILVLLIAFVLWLVEEDTTPAPEAKKKAAVAKEAGAGDQNGAKDEPEKKELSADVIASLEENYALALAKYEAGEYYLAKEYLEVIRGIDPNYKDTQTLNKLVKQGYEELLRLKAEEEAEKERKKRQLKIQALLKKAKAAVDKREVAVAESLFGQVLEIDPENLEIPQYKLELDAYKEEQNRIKEEEEIRKARRMAMVESLQPGKTLFLKEDWYKAIDRLEKFTQKSGMDEDLVKEATDMLMKARQNLSAQINPLLGRARSFKEGQDYKRAFETYGEVLKFEPSNEEAITEREQIKESLRIQSMKIYREALISESLSLFDEAREKFQEVQQVSPVNSDYYNKATEKLKNYLE